MIIVSCMDDIGTIGDQFDELASFHELYSSDGRRLVHTLWPLRDRHDDADRWIAADPAERVTLRAKAELKHAAIRHELARIRIVTREDYLARKRKDMKAWREANSDKDKARQKAWREANREYTRAHMVTYRKKVASDPERREAVRLYNQERMRKRRALEKASRTARVFKTPEQKRSYDKEYARKHPRKLTESQRLARNEYYRTKHRMEKEAKRMGVGIVSSATEPMQAVPT